MPTYIAPKTRKDIRLASLNQAYAYERRRMLITLTSFVCLCITLFVAASN